MDHQALYLTLANFSKYSLAVPLAVGVFSYTRSKFRPTTPQIRIGALVLLSLVFEILAVRGGLIQQSMSYFFDRETNLPGLHLFTLLQCWLIIWVYQDFILKVASRWLLNTIVIGFGIFVVVNAVWLDGIWKLNPHARAVESLLILSIVFTYFYTLLQRTEFARLEKDPLFWVSAGLTIYFSGSFFIFLASNYFLESRDLLRAIYSIHSVLNIIANLFYAAALWVITPK